MAAIRAAVGASNAGTSIQIPQSPIRLWRRLQRVDAASPQPPLKREKSLLSGLDSMSVSLVLDKPERTNGGNRARRCRSRLAALPAHAAKNGKIS
jgi:hypothetical protein